VVPGQLLKSASGCFPEVVPCTFSGGHWDGWLNLLASSPAFVVGHMPEVQFSFLVQVKGSYVHFQCHPLSFPGIQGLSHQPRLTARVHTYQFKIPVRPGHPLPAQKKTRRRRRTSMPYHYSSIPSLM
jgi:hypothetical protein